MELFLLPRPPFPLRVFVKRLELLRICFENNHHYYYLHIDQATPAHRSGSTYSQVKQHLPTGQAKISSCTHVVSISTFTQSNVTCTRVKPASARSHRSNSTCTDTDEAGIKLVHYRHSEQGALTQIKPVLPQYITGIPSRVH